jgi:hypothetical protein
VVFFHYYCSILFPFWTGTVGKKVKCALMNDVRV